MTSNPERVVQRSTRFHPYKIFLTLVLAGITVLFLAFSVAYVYSRVQLGGVPPVKLPGLFIFNTLLLVGSSATIWWANQCYQKDKTEAYQLALGVTIALTVAFVVLQLFGWQQLFRQEVFLTSSTLTSYLYVISALHFMHVLAGLPFLILFLAIARKRMKEPVSVLVYFSDPEKRMKLKLLTIYWHFLDVLWIYLVVFFLVNWLIG